MELSKNYIPGTTEEKWTKHWHQKQYFASKPDNRKAFTVVIPPPNVTGVLHMGHTLNETVQDILVRKARMSGFNACWVPGSDHASIATEAKVVQMLKEKGIDKNNLTREEFLTYAFEWKEKYGNIIYSQIEKLGCSVDWNRTSFTMDDHYYKAVMKVFVAMYNKGLIYRGVAVRHLEAGVAYLARLLLEDRADELLLGGELGLALGRDLADQQVAGVDLGADAHDTALVEVGERLLGAVGDIAGDLLVAELGGAGVDLVLLDVDGGEEVVLHDLLAEDDGVLEVVAFPAHERDQQVAAQGDLAVVGGRPVGEHVAGLHLVAREHERLLVDERALVGTHELDQAVRVDRALAGVDLDVVGVDVADLAARARPGSRRRCRRRRGTPCRCPRRAPRESGAAPPGAACWNPSGRGWRRRARETG